MRRLAIAFATMALVLSAGSAWAQLATYDDPLGDIYLSFDNTALPNSTATQRYKDVSPFVAFSFYIMISIDFGDPPYNDDGLNQSAGAEAWEGSVVPGAALTVTSRTLPPGHSDFGNGDDNWIVGSGGNCLTGNNTPFVLVTYSALLLSAVQNHKITMGVATPSSFNAPPRGPGDEIPGWARCLTHHLVPTKARWQSGWIKVNCTVDCPPTSNDEASWGVLKAAYSGQ